MCFSATASFAASGVLLGATALSFRELKGSKYALFALIPFLFAIQQVIEGFQWLSFAGGGPNLILGYGFLLFAFLLWPMYLPIAALQIERAAWRRKVLFVFLVLGTLTTLFLLFALLSAPLTVAIQGRCIAYSVPSVFPPLLLAVTYLFATCGSGLIVNRFWIQVFAAVTLFGAVFTAIAFSQAFTSVWCFFAAVLSVILIIELRAAKQAGKQRKLAK